MLAAMNHTDPLPLAIFNQELIGAATGVAIPTPNDVKVVLLCNTVDDTELPVTFFLPSLARGIDLRELFGMSCIPAFTVSLKLAEARHGHGRHVGLVAPLVGVELEVHELLACNEKALGVLTKQHMRFQQILLVVNDVGRGHTHPPLAFAVYDVHR